MQQRYLRLDGRDGFQRIFARAHDDHAADCFAFAIELANAAAHLRTHLNAGHVSQAHGYAARSRAQGNSAKVLQALKVARRPHHVLGLSQLKHRAAGFLVGLLDGFGHFGVRDGVSGQLLRVEHDLVLPHHAADRSHLGNIGHRLQFVLEKPVLQRPQLPQVLRAAAVDQRILVNPAHARRVRAERGLGLRRQARLDLVEVLQHPRARPVKIGSVFKQDINERVAEKGIPPNRFGARHRKHGGGQRVSDLIFDNTGRLAGVRRADDDLHIGQIGQRIQRCLEHRVHPPGPQHQGCQKDQKAIDNGPANKLGDHF